MRIINYPALLTGVEDITSRKTGEKFLKLFLLIGRETYESLAPRGFELNGERAKLEAEPPQYVPCTVTGGMRASRQATGYYEPYFDSVIIDEPAPRPVASK